MSIHMHQPGRADPRLRKFLRPQVEPVVALPENSALPGFLINNDEGHLARAIRHLDQVRLHSFASELLALPTSRGIVADLAHIAGAQAPAVASYRSRRGLSAWKHARRENLRLGVKGREAGHTNERVGGIEPDSDDIGAIVARVPPIGGRSCLI